MTKRKSQGSASKKTKQPRKKRPTKTAKTIVKKPAAKRDAKKDSKKAATKKKVGTRKAAGGRAGGSRRAKTKEPPALSEEEREALLALQDELGIPPGVRPANEDECRRVLAYHEAGHAVVGHVLGRTLHAVSATQHCAFEPLPGEWTQTDIEDSAKIALAGPHASGGAVTLPLLRVRRTCRGSFLRPPHDRSGFARSEA